MTMRRACLGLLPLALACAPSKPPQAAAESKPAAGSAATPEQKDVAELFGRELDTLPAPVGVRGRGWRASVQGNAPQVDPAEDNADAITIPIGTEQAINCVVFAEGIDAATTVARAIDSVGTEATLSAVQPLGVVVEQEHPVYFILTTYTLDSPRGKLGGQLKLAVAPRARPLLCLHDEAGYVKTFERVVRGLAGSAQIEGEVRPTAVSVAVVKLGDVPVGFAHSWQELGAGGDRISASISARIIPRSATELVVSDEASRVTISNDRVKEGLWVEAEPQGMTMSITLKPPKGGVHEVSGTANGKPVSGKVSAPGGIPSGRATAQRVARELEKGKAFRFSQKEYAPSLDPLGLVEVSYWRDASDEARVVHTSFGKVQLKIRVDAGGFPVFAEMDAGGKKLVIEQIYERDDERGKAGSRAKK